MYALLVTYRLAHASPAEHAELCDQLTPSLAAVPGLVSKTWLANDATGRHGTFYVFEDRGAFDAFVASELFSLIAEHPSITDVTTSDYAVREGLVAQAEPSLGGVSEG